MSFLFMIYDRILHFGTWIIVDEPKVLSVPDKLFVLPDDTNLEIVNQSQHHGSWCPVAPFTNMV